MPERTSEKKPVKKTVKKTTRKTTAKKSVAKKAVAKKTTTRKVAANKASTSTTKSGTKRAVQRKVPTTLAAQAAKRSFEKKLVLISLGIFCVVLVGSAFIGSDGTGYIDVTSAIEERKRKADEKELARIENIAVKQTKGKPFGGLVGSGQVNTPKPKAEETKTASSTESVTASSTDATASSTEPVTEENISDEIATTTIESSTAQ